MFNVTVHFKQNTKKERESQKQKKIKYLEFMYCCKYLEFMLYLHQYGLQRLGMEPMLSTLWERESFFARTLCPNSGVMGREAGLLVGVVGVCACRSSSSITWSVEANGGEFGGDDASSASTSYRTRGI